MKWSNKLLRSGQGADAAVLFTIASGRSQVTHQGAHWQIWGARNDGAHGIEVRLQLSLTWARDKSVCMMYQAVAMVRESLLLLLRSPLDYSTINTIARGIQVSNSDTGPFPVNCVRIGAGAALIRERHVRTGVFRVCVARLCSAAFATRHARSSIVNDENFHGPPQAAFMYMVKCSVQCKYIWMLTTWHLRYQGSHGGTTVMHCSIVDWFLKPRLLYRFPHLALLSCGNLMVQKANRVQQPPGSMGCDLDRSNRLRART